MNITTVGIDLAKNLLSDTQHREISASRVRAVKEGDNTSDTPAVSSLQQTIFSRLPQ